MTDPLVVAGLIEGGKLFLQGYFTLMRQAGKTEDEINQMFNDEHAEFKQKTPDKLKDV